MLWIYLIVLQILFFIGLLFFLKHVLTRNISKATGHLQELGKDYVSKEEEASRLLEQAQKDAKALVSKEKKEAEEAKEKMMKEVQDLREKILKEANKRSVEITEKAERNAEFLTNELDQKIETRAKEKVLTLIQQAVPKNFLQDIHERWIGGLNNGELDFKHLKLPEKTKEAKIVSAFDMTSKQREELTKQIKKKAGSGIDIKVEVDPSIIAGYVISIGSVVVDASLKYTIQKKLQEEND